MSKKVAFLLAAIANRLEDLHQTYPDNQDLKELFETVKKAACKASGFKSIPERKYGHE